jgi:hypothetical protein
VVGGVSSGIVCGVLFYDDQLPDAPGDQEVKLAEQLGEEELRAIDARIEGLTQARWLKVARIVADALQAGGYSTREESHVHLHVRRVIGLVNSGALEAQGNVRRPRWSEVRFAPRSRRGGAGLKLV